MNKLYLIVPIVLAGALIAGAIVYTNIAECNSNQTGVSSDEVANNMITFINEELLQGQATVSLTNITEESGLYKIDFDLQGREISSYATKDGEIFFPEGIKVNEQPESNNANTTTPEQPADQTIGNFSVSEEDVCLEDGKPILYFFGSKSCSHCAWEHPVVENVAAEFGDAISFHNNMDSDEDMDVFSNYSSGGIPTVVIGCKYFRVGSGENLGEEQESDNLKALICKLTGNEPGEVCDGVKDIINQIN